MNDRTIMIKFSTSPRFAGGKSLLIHTLSTTLEAMGITRVQVDADAHVMNVTLNDEERRMLADLKVMRASQRRN